MVKKLAIVLPLAALLSLLVCRCSVTSQTGCVDDSDCRHDRICVDGLCRWPSPITPSDGGVSPTDAADELTPEAFCEGPARAQQGDVLLEPVAVTTRRMFFRACCEDVSLHFHTDERLGFDVFVSVGWSAGDLPTDHPMDLAALPEGVQVSVCHLDPYT